MNKNVIISVLAILVLALSYIVFNRQPKAFDDTLYKYRESQLKRQRDSLEALLKDELFKANGFQTKIDSLEKLKPKIKYVTIEKNNKIDNASVGVVIDEFKSIFATGGIK